MIGMNYRGAWLGTILGASVYLAAPAGGAAQQPPQVTGAAATLPPQRLPIGPAAPSTSKLQQDLTQLHAELADLTAHGDPSGPTKGDGEAERLAQIARLRARVQQLVMQIRQQRSTARKPVAPPTPARPAVQPPTSPQSTPLPTASTPKPAPPTPPLAQPTVQPAVVATTPIKQFDLPPARIGQAVDPWALAQALFESHDNENALKAYQALDASDLPPGDRVTVRYMIACCLRNLGKRDEAATKFRDVANSRDNDMLADCARWQLHALRWRQDLETQLAGFRQRRQALESKP